jgi:hypothetical protein
VFVLVLNSGAIHRREVIVDVAKREGEAASAFMHFCWGSLAWGEKGLGSGRNPNLT